jgi:hypothetical protein
MFETEQPRLAELLREGRVVEVLPKCRSRKFNLSVSISTRCVRVSTASKAQMAPALSEAADAKKNILPLR